MKKFIYLIIPFFVFGATKTFAQYEGTFGGGVHLNYGDKFKTAGAGIHLNYYATNQVRIAPSFTQYLKHGGTKIWAAESDAHYMIAVTREFSFYPLAGLNFERFSPDPGLNVKKYSRIGTNIGLGIQYDIQYHVSAHLESKYQLIKDYSQFMFLVGIGYWF